MKVGSLVERVPYTSHKDESATKNAITAAGYIYPKYETIYTVRGFTDNGNTAIYLEEIVNPKILTKFGMCEVGFSINNFRELQPPIDLTQIMEYQHPIHLLTSTQS